MKSNSWIFKNKRVVLILYEYFIRRLSRLFHSILSPVSFPVNFGSHLPIFPRWARFRDFIIRSPVCWFCYRPFTNSRMRFNLLFAFAGRRGLSETHALVGSLRGCACRTGSPVGIASGRRRKGAAWLGHGVTGWRMLGRGKAFLRMHRYRERSYQFSR